MVGMFSKDDESKQPPTALVNVQLRNSMALLRRCCNHPYLIEYPMDNGQLRIDELLVAACGKLMLLDRMLAELKRNGHKVCSCTVLHYCFVLHVTKGYSVNVELNIIALVAVPLAVFLRLIQPVSITLKCAE